MAEGVGQGEAGVDVIGYLERLAQCRRECLDGGRRVAEGERGSFAVPCRPAIDVSLTSVPGIAAHPMYVGQDIFLLLLPSDAVGEVFPEAAATDAVHQREVGIYFHHAASAGEGTAQLTQDVGIGSAHLGNATAVLGEDEAMRHHAVDGTEGRVLNKVLIDETVAVGNPLFAAVALVAHCAPVVLLTPDGISHLEPEGRRPGADGGVEEHVGLHLAKLLFDVDDALGILFARRAGIRPDCAELAADAVELEVIEVVVVEHEAGSVEKYVVVGRIGELHAALAAPVAATVVAALSVAAHGAEPCADVRVHAPSLVAEFLEAIGEVRVELPRSILVPAVVPHEGADAYAVLVEEVQLPLVEDFQALCFVEVRGVVRVVVAVDVQFEPGIVHRERTPRHGPFALAVAEEGTACLTGSNEADHGAYLPCLAFCQRGLPAPFAKDFRLCRRGEVQVLVLDVAEVDVAGRCIVAAVGIEHNIVSEGVGPSRRNGETIDIVRLCRSGEAGVIVGSRHVAVGICQLHTGDGKTVIAGSIHELRGEETAASGKADGLRHHFYPV